MIRNTHKRRRAVISALAAVGMGVLATLGTFATSAGAQTDPYSDPYIPISDPYAPSTTTAGQTDCSSGPTISINTSTAANGAQIIITVTCFQGGSTVVLTMFSTPTVLGEMLIGSDGVGKKTFSVPCDKEAGDHTIEATGTDANGNNAKVSTALAVTAAVCGSNQNNNSGGGNSGGGNNLARTGAGIGIVVAVGAVFLFGGWVLIRRADQLTGE